MGLGDAWAPAPWKQRKVGVLCPTLSTFVLERATGSAASGDSAVCEAETFRHPPLCVGPEAGTPRKRAEYECSGKGITPGGGRPSSWHSLRAVV